VSTATLSQSAHEPASAAAAAVHELGLVLYLALGLVFVGVMIATAVAVRGRGRAGDGMHWILVGGLALPLVVVGTLFALSLRVGLEPKRAHADSVATIRVTGRQWWWDVRYQPPGRAAPVRLANELHLPVGQPVALLLDTQDVIHSFWVPALGGKVDMVPGRQLRLVVEATREGVFRGQCAEYCGTQHALMSLVVVAEPAERFGAWLAAQAEPAAEPADPRLARGRDVFFAAGCAECHAVRGTRAAATDGPDLTHVGSRRTLGAAVLGRNDAGALAGWIAGNEALKPGNHMLDQPLPGAELRALAAWLASLQ
jgi:cytochrome c oxidase subunit 2